MQTEQLNHSTQATQRTQTGQPQTVAQPWVKPTFEQVSLNHALSGHNSSVINVSDSITYNGS